MAFTLPNAIAYGSTIAALEQAEPDSVDFQILGDNRNFVISGGDVTSVVQNATQYIDMAVSSSEVYINSTFGSISSGTVTIAAAPGSGSRFDIVCALNNAGTFSYAVVTGTVSTTNPVFPAIASGYLPLYAVLVRADLKTSTLSRVYVDKRRLTPPAVVRSGSATPTGGSSGDFYFKTGAIASGQSNLWFNNAGTWQNLAGYVYPIDTAATANTLVARGSGGSISGGTITASSFSGPLTGNVTGNVTGTVTGSLVGNASTATAFNSSRTVTLSSGGDVTGSASATDGNYTLTATIGNGKVTSDKIDYAVTVPRITVSQNAPGTTKAGDVWVQI